MIYFVNTFNVFQREEKKRDLLECEVNLQRMRIMLKVSLIIDFFSFLQA